MPQPNDKRQNITRQKAGRVLRDYDKELDKQTQKQEPQTEPQETEETPQKEPTPQRKQELNTRFDKAKQQDEEPTKLQRNNGLTTKTLGATTGAIGKVGRGLSKSLQLAQRGKSNLLKTPNRLNTRERKEMKKGYTSKYENNYWSIGDYSLRQSDLLKMNVEQRRYGRKVKPYTVMDEEGNRQRKYEVQDSENQVSTQSRNQRQQANQEAYNRYTENIDKTQNKMQHDSPESPRTRLRQNQDGLYDKHFGRGKKRKLA